MLKLKSRLESDVFSAILMNREDEDEQNKHKLVKVLESNAFQLILLVITFYSLFFDDYQELLCGKQLDLVFDIFSFIIMSIFAFELVISSLFIKGYFNSYFFYLDLISTLSIIIDLNMIKNLLNTGFTSGSDSISKVAKLIRLVRLIRLFRISRIYKSFSKNRPTPKRRTLPRTSKQIDSITAQIVDNFHADSKGKIDMAKPKSPLLRQSADAGFETTSNSSKMKSGKDSKVGKKISEVATKTVILMVFILLILLPIFNADFWTNTDLSGDSLCNHLGQIMSQNFTSSADLKSIQYSEDNAKLDYDNQTKMMALTLKTIRDNMSSQGVGKLLRVQIKNNENDYYLDKDYSKLRFEEMALAICTVGAHTIAVYSDDTSEAILGAGLNILRTFYICVILIGGSYLFKYYAQTLVITPIERMIKKAANVIKRPQEIKEEAFIEQEAKEYKAFMDKIEGKNLDDDDGKEDDAENKQLETMFLEEAISKISVLLGVGLGDAGSELIYNYLKNEKDILNIASEIQAIFGFCDIRNFTDATEVLQEEVMIFVNTIADIVHSLADMSLGAANKNVGDAFLVVWRIRPEDSLPIHRNGVELSVVWNNIADLAFYSVLAMHAEIGRAYSLKKFIDNPDLQERIGKGFKIRLGFGLHFGWAIEGALGSLFKIDATYLSPNVNMSMRLEGDTKIYGVPILMSGEFFDLLSLPIKSYCRQIDSLKSHDQETPLRLFSPLVTDKYIKYTQSQPIDKHLQKTQERSNFKKVVRADIHAGRLLGKRIFQNDKDISILTSAVDPRLVKHFRNGYDDFTYGNWSHAKKNFEGVLAVDPKDGPSLFLLDYMNKFSFKKPDWWNGYRIDEGGSGH